MPGPVPGIHVFEAPRDGTPMLRSALLNVMIQAAYKARARDLAARGDQVQLQELNVARDEAMKGNS